MCNLLRKMPHKENTQKNYSEVEKLTTLSKYM